MAHGREREREREREKESSQRKSPPPYCKAKKKQPSLWSSCPPMSCKAFSGRGLPQVLFGLRTAYWALAREVSWSQASPCSVGFQDQQPEQSCTSAPGQCWRDTSEPSVALVKLKNARHLHARNMTFPIKGSGWTLASWEPHFIFRFSEPTDSPAKGYADKSFARTLHVRASCHNAVAKEEGRLSWLCFYPMLQVCLANAGLPAYQFIPVWFLEKS